MYSIRLINEASALRRKGLSFDEINKELKLEIPRSTMSYWFKNVVLSESAANKIYQRNIIHLVKAREIGIKKHTINRSKYLNDLVQKNFFLKEKLSDESVAKLVLAILYLGEGGKNLQRSSVMFGNSDPDVINLFLKLIRQCYRIDENKFRCTVQCRWDQDEPRLKKFWSCITGIPMSKFYNSRVDKRTINKVTTKPNYKGVCRIDYLSSGVFHDILSIIKVVTGARSSIGGASGWQSEG